MTSVAGGWCRQTAGLGNHRVAIELQLEMHDLVLNLAPYLPTIIMLKLQKIKSGRMTFPAHLYLLLAPSL